MVGEIDAKLPDARNQLIGLDPMHTALAAEGRSPDIPEEMDLYG
jgi:hypothetical protein